MFASWLVLLKVKGKNLATDVLDTWVNQVQVVISSIDASYVIINEIKESFFNFLTQKHAV